MHIECSFNDIIVDHARHRYGKKFRSSSHPLRPRWHQDLLCIPTHEPVGQCQEQAERVPSYHTLLAGNPGHDALWTVISISVPNSRSAGANLPSYGMTDAACALVGVDGIFHLNYEIVFVDEHQGTH
jgi:hypothetical protein